MVEDGDQQVCVVEMEAVDEFWDLADFFYGGSLTEAKQVIQVRLEADLRIYGACHLKVANAKNRLANLLQKEGSYEQALSVFGDSLAGSKGAFWR